MTPTDNATMPEGYPDDLLAGFICEFNIIRRHFATYPPHHPIIDSCARKVVSLLEQLLTGHSELTLGITRNALMLGSDILDRKNPIFRDLAGYFFRRGVASLTFTHGLTRQELLRFCELTGNNREPSVVAGLADELDTARIRAIQVRMVRYDALRSKEGIASDGDPAGAPLWEQFIAGLMRDLPPSDIESPAEGAPPEQMAQYFNRRMAVIPPGERAHYSRSIAGFIRSVDQQVAGRSRDQAVERWQGFVERLAPELQREALREVFPEQPLEIAAEKDFWETDNGIDFLVDTEAAPAMEDRADRQIRLVFREDFIDQDFFLGEQRPSLLPHLIPGETDKMRESLAEPRMLGQLATAILALRRFGGSTDSVELLERRLEELCWTLLRQENLTTLTQIAMIRERNGETKISLFKRADFLEEILNGLQVWGTDKFGEIAPFIDAVGEPFTNQLLIRLSVEENPLVCRYYLERLKNIGTPARDAALTRLRDEGWQFVMNLIILLRNFNDSRTLQEVRLLAGHQNLRVRTEVLKTLLHFGDPEGEKRLIKEMDSVRFDIQVAAVRLAGEYGRPRIVQKLRALLAHTAIIPQGYTLKEAIIDSLARIGNPAALPDLERFLKSRTLFCTGLLKSVKLRAAKSLRHYPADTVDDGLRKLAADILRGETQKR
jgi:HEAT repeat protein